MSILLNLLKKKFFNSILSKKLVLLENIFHENFFASEKLGKKRENLANGNAAYKRDIFSGTSETTMHRPFHICNHSSLYTFLQNFVNCLHIWTIMFNHDLLLKHNTWLGQNHHF